MCVCVGYHVSTADNPFFGSFPPYVKSNSVPSPVELFDSFGSIVTFSSLIMTGSGSPAEKLVTFFSVVYPFGVLSYPL